MILDYLLISRFIQVFLASHFLWLKPEGSTIAKLCISIKRTSNKFRGRVRILIPEGLCFVFWTPKLNIKIFVSRINEYLWQSSNLVYIIYLIFLDKLFSYRIFSHGYHCLTKPKVNNLSHKKNPAFVVHIFYATQIP